MRAKLMYRASMPLKDSLRRNPADAQVCNHGGVGLGVADSRNSDVEDSVVLRNASETYVQSSDAA